jgi:hypothetical protein
MILQYRGQTLGPTSLGHHSDHPAADGDHADRFRADRDHADRDDADRGDAHRGDSEAGGADRHGVDGDRPDGDHADCNQTHRDKALGESPTATKAFMNADLIAKDEPNPDTTQILFEMLPGMHRDVAGVTAY